MLLEAKSNGWSDKLISILSPFNTKGGGAAGEAGRPQKDAGELSEEGSATRASGMNTARGGKV